MQPVTRQNMIKQKKKDAYNLVNTYTKKKKKKYINC